MGMPSVRAVSAWVLVAAAALASPGAKAGGAPLLDPLTDVTQVVPGLDHTCAITAAGGVKCWGGNGVGQLGDGTTTSRSHAADVTGLTSGVVGLAAGAYHTCAVTAAGGVKCWGSNNEGQLGAQTPAVQSTPVDVTGLTSGMQAVSGGGYFTCALTTGGGVKCWGSDQLGQIGDGGSIGQVIPTPADVVGLASGVQAVRALAFHACALTTGGGVKCWGSNNYGQLGFNAGTNYTVPVDVTGLASGAIAIGAGGEHSCAIVTGGGVKCWGSNLYGQIGDGGGSDQGVPVSVVGLTGVTEIGGIGFHSCALTGSGAAKCWGRNDAGQLGDASTTQSSVPVDVSGLGTGVARIAVGSYHTCAITAGGSLQCWGYNGTGQLGDGTLTSSSIPVAVLTEDDGSRRVATLTPAGDNASVAPQSNASGRFVVFQSAATNLVGSDQNGGSDIYLIDRETASVVRASVNDDETESGGGATAPSISADGGLVSFVAPDAAIAKVLGETKAQARLRMKQGTTSLFLRNLVTGSTQRIGFTTPPSGAAKPRLAPNGKAIVYTAINADASAGAVGQANVFRVALAQVGDEVIPQAPECVSCQARSAMGVPTGSVDGESDNAVVSADARYVVYESKAGNAIAGAPAPCPNVQIMLRDMVLGLVQRVSPPPGVSGVNCGTVGSTNPSVDWSGNTIVFSSDAALKPGLLPGRKNVFSEFNGGIEHLTRAPDGSAADGGSDQAVISGDANTVVFSSDATNLDGGSDDTNNVRDLYAVSRRSAGGTLTGGRVARLARSTDGSQANAASDRPALNYNATLLTFDSAASNLVGGDANGQVDIFERSIPATTSRVFGASFE